MRTEGHGQSASLRSHFHDADIGWSGETISPGFDFSALPVRLVVISLATSSKAEADKAGEAGAQEAYEGDDAHCSDEHGDEQEKGGGGGAEDGIDDAKEDADEGHGASLRYPDFG